ncbi:MAG: T9SS type A sorting domain-containing protein [Bacteroidales bacterium]|nr:T9SS type A sorting domain-containing protein [Bacteroidales bacterium]MBN2698759.1 T9SS type A sorting domain-containing protein [Bacteroidales bacterium]
MVYPNPSTGIFRLNFPPGVTGYQIYDMSGRQISTGTLSGRTAVLDLSDYHAGMYILKTGSANGEGLPSNSVWVGHFNPMPLIVHFLSSEPEPMRNEIPDLPEGDKPTPLHRKPVVHRILKRMVDFVETFINGVVGA